MSKSISIIGISKYIINHIAFDTLYIYHDSEKLKFYYKIKIIYL